MKTVRVFAELFNQRTTGAKACFTVNALTLDAVKIVLRNTMIKFETEGADEDERNGFLKKCNYSAKYYGGRDGYLPTAKGFRAILAALM